jgi:hypothetical protein
VAGVAVPGGGGLGGLGHLVVQLVVGIGGLQQAPLAGGAGLVGAVGACLGSVPLVFGGFVSAASRVLTSAAETMTAGGPGGCGATGRDDGTTT